jgi:hypothetical protein
MRAWVDWDQDGCITYAESVNELADHVITTMEANSKNVMEELDKLEAVNQEKLTESKRQKHLAIVGAATSADTGAKVSLPALPPNLNQYLFDSFQSYDTDKSGSLELVEFWPFIRSVFSHNFTDADLEQLEVCIC